MAKRSRAIAGLDDGVSTFSYILDLPDDITQEILFRLPIKDVKHCRSVSKSWRTIISNPEFSNFYSNYSNHTPLLSFKLNSINHSITLLEIPTNGGENNYLRTTQIVPNMLPGWFDRLCHFSYVGSCKGYICLIKYKNVDTVYIINPIIGYGDHIVLPEIAHHLNTRYFFGFGQGKMKVLRYVLEEDSRSRACEIFVVGSDQNWRSLSIDLIGQIEYNTDVVDFNGVLHWLPVNIVFSNFLYTFDLASEEAGKIPAPRSSALMKEHVELRVLKNHLTLINYHGNDSYAPQVTIWTMQEYGRAESWTKYVVQKSWISPGKKINFVNIGELKDGKMLFASSDWHMECVISYDVHQKKGYKVMILNSVYVRANDFHSYSPSFSSRTDRSYITSAVVSVPDVEQEELAKSKQPEVARLTELHYA